MMTGGKVILTYKRQRSPHWIAYKRKRPRSRNNFSLDNEYPDAECPSYHGASTAEKQEESTEDNKSDCPSNKASITAEKQEQSTEGFKSEFPRYNALITAEKQEEFTEGKKSECPSPSNIALITAEEQDESTECNRSECSAKDYELAPEGKRQFSCYINQQNGLVSAENTSGVEDKNLFVRASRQLVADSHAVLDASAMGVISQKAARDQLSGDLHNPGKPNSIQEASHLYVTSISACDDKSTMKYLVPLSASCSSGTDAQQVSLKSSIRKDYNSDCTITSESDKVSLKENGLPVENKSNSFCTTATLQSKFSSPLITFYRRCKRRKEVDGLHKQNSLGVAEDCALEFKGSKSADFTSAGGATPPESGSEHELVNTYPSEKNLSRRVTCDAFHEKQMASRDVEYSCASRSSPDTGNVKQADDQLENTSQDNQSTVEIIPQNSVGVDFQEGPISCSGNLSNDSSNDPSHEPILFNGHAAVGKESQGLCSDDLNTVIITNEIPRSSSCVMSLDFSVPLPNSHDIEDCGIASVHDEQQLHSAPNSRSGSHTTFFNDESPGNKGSEFLHDRGEERHPPHQAQASENGCHSKEAVGHKYNNFASSSPVFELENSCLQLFPEDRTDDMFQSTKTLQNFTTHSDSEDRTVNLFESRSEASPAATNSSLFLGLFLPMELINDGHDRSSTSSQWPNVGVQSKEFSQDTVPQFFPNQVLSYQRHKMVLDNIVSRARMPKRKRGSCLDLYDSPRMWSEEELDCLWVGIRRYGRGNWDVMLRDPRLRFSPWRTPRDLAEQWEEEQCKLFNPVPSSRGRHLRTPNIFRDSVPGFWHPKTGKENLVDDVQLSLGDVYSRPIDSVHKRSVSNFFDAQNNAPRQLQKAVTNVRTMYSCRGNRRRAMLHNNAMLDFECSLSANQSTCMAMGGNLPHWLREVVSIPLRPPQTVFPANTSSVGHLEMQWVKKPFLDAKGIHNEPRNEISNKHAIIERGEQQTVAGAHNGNFPSAMEHNKTEQVLCPGNKQDLIIIDSDASSEETISDDHSAKV